MRLFWPLVCWCSSLLSGGARHSQITVNRTRISDISYPGPSNSSTVTSFYNLTPRQPQLWPQPPAALKHLHRYVVQLLFSETKTTESHLVLSSHTVVIIGDKKKPTLSWKWLLELWDKSMIHLHDSSLHASVWWTVDQYRLLVFSACCKRSLESACVRVCVCACRWSEWIRGEAGLSGKGCDLCGDLSDPEGREGEHWSSEATY